MRYLILFVCLLFLSGCEDKKASAAPKNNQETSVIKNNRGYLVSDIGEDFILDQEISSTLSNHKYYDKHYQKPEWPQGDSGITIAVGYDLGFEQNFDYDWKDILTEDDYKDLKSVCGYSGEKARKVLSEVNHVLIQWGDAYEVFNQKQLPREYLKTARAFPGMDKLSLNAQSALVSLVYNRGASLIGPSRTEMREIRDLVPKRDYQGIADQLVIMTRIWKGSSIEDGMTSRRRGEAKLVLTPDSK